MPNARGPPRTQLSRRSPETGACRGANMSYIARRAALVIPVRKGTRTNFFCHRQTVVRLLSQVKEL
jgi:hypothetical protein